jgi:preprotein translocase subunit SecF
MSLGHKLYRGEAGLDFVGRRKVIYLVAAVCVALSLLSFGLKGFNFGIEFSGGNSFQVPKQPGVTLADTRKAMEDTGTEVVSTQEIGGGDPNYLIRTEGLSQTRSEEVKSEIAAKLGISVATISDDRVSASWGGQITRKALIGLIVFLILVSIYLAVRYEWRMAIGAMVALVHDLVITAGIYSLVGFEVTPSTVIGLLTILGFSLYDTVVVFDKVAENAKGILGGTRYTYSGAANLAVNQSLMRSINTSIIAMLPVAGLLFIGAGLLGAGTLKDLGLVLFVGMAAGAYSSIFLATPIVADLKEREPRYRALRARVLAKRQSEAAQGRAQRLAPVAAAATSAGESAAVDTADPAEKPVKSGAKPGTRPAQKKRAGNKPGRPSGSKRRR